jgi:uncharacterized protein (TIGR02646 family)
MKYIPKLNEPSALISFKEKHKLNAVYGDLYPRTKDKIKHDLLYEQGYICCYCMKPIRQNNSHIEHVKPQSLFPLKTLDYYNMLVSCNGYSEKGENCGHNKANWWDAQEFVTPLQHDCEQMFIYSIAGQMDSIKKCGKTTIGKLKLNSYLLVRARSTALYMSGFFDDNFEQRKQEIINTYSRRDKENKLQPFCMAVLYCIEKFG